VLGRSVPLALLPLAFHLERLLADLVDRRRQRRLPRTGIAHAVQEFLSASVERDIGAMAVFLARQDRLSGHGAVVQQPFEPSEFLVDETANGRGDFDVTAGEFESHGIARLSLRARRSAESLRATAKRVNKGPFADSMSESSVPPGTSQSSAARGPAPR